MLGPVVRIEVKLARSMTVNMAIKTRNAETGLPAFFDHRLD